MSHGAPTVLLEKNGFPSALKSFADSIPRPVAVVVLSAHWLTRGTGEITSTPVNKTMHDFGGGFPRELHEMTYSAPGEPGLAGDLLAALGSAGIKAALNVSRGLDHGAWIPLKIMYPDENIPVVQISMPYPAAPDRIFNMGNALAQFREGGVMLIGSGNMTHNLSELEWGNEKAEPSKEVLEFDATVVRAVESGNFGKLFDYGKSLPNMARMHPTDEHFLPLFFTLGCGAKGDVMRTIYDGVQYGTLSMRCFYLSAADDAPV